MNLSNLENSGYDIRILNHAKAVFTKDFPGPLDELCSAILDLRIDDVELIRGGGGEAPFTRRLRRSLAELSWHKRNIVIKKIVDGKERAAITHEIDHVRRSDNGTIALEIEWNNKDPFFDRDLENFQRLHSEGAISVGVIVTRGQSLQNEIQQIVMSCADRYGARGFEDLQHLFDLSPTSRQREFDTGARSMISCTLGRGVSYRTNSVLRRHIGTNSWFESIVVWGIHARYC